MSQPLLTLFAGLLLGVSSAHAASDEKVLYSFNGTTDGGSPSGGVIFDKSGNIYGASNGCYWGPFGAVYQLSDTKSGWIENTLYSFADGLDGGCPINNLHFDNAGNPIGATDDGGNGQGDGVIYRVVPDGEYWSLEVLYQFGGGDDGSSPNEVISDAHGNLYGTTSSGGANNYGTVFELTPQPNGNWTFTLIYTFDGAEGGTPNGGVLMDSKGNLYGTALWGPHGLGVVYRLSPAGQGQWAYTVLHAFSGNDGSRPWREIIMDPSGNLYGTAGGGPKGQGIVFELQAVGNGWRERLLHGFNGGNGSGPTGLALDALGNVYGVASGGTHALGLVYKLTNVSGHWNSTVLHNFNGSDGSDPQSSLTYYNGNIYGTTRQGGQQNLGTVFEVVP
jgi:uncharacterized repeat protein (TIGR03803 family)